MSVSSLSSVQKIRAETLMTYFENNSPLPQYGFSSPLNDGRGLTCGRAGFTTRDGDWLAVVTEYTALVPNNSLAKYLPVLQGLAASVSASLQGLDGMAAAIVQCAQDPAFQTIQDRHQDSDSYLPAMARSDLAGTKTALSRAVLYDTVLQHGNSNDGDGTPTLIARASAQLGGSPATGVDEAKWLNTLLNVREADLLNPAAAATKIEWSASTDRLNVFRALINDGNWDLSKAINIHTRDYDFSLPQAQTHGALPFHGQSSQFRLSAQGDGASFAIADGVVGGSRTYQVSDLNCLQFNDKAVFVATSEQANIARLYSAAFNRAPDSGGLNYWEDQYASLPVSAKAQGAGLRGIAANFVNSAEFKQIYGNPTDGQFMTALYQNVLGRTPDPAGLNYWLTDLAAGDSRAAVLMGFAVSTENIAKVDVLQHPTNGWLLQV